MGKLKSCSSYSIKYVVVILPCPPHQDMLSFFNKLSLGCNDLRAFTST